MLDRTTIPERYTVLTACAQCGKPIIGSEWSERVSERCVRDVWSCDLCGYEFETSVYMRSKAA
jgi:ribosomal protein L37AE/L43A